MRGWVLHNHVKVRGMGPTLSCQGGRDGSHTIMPTVGGLQLLSFDIFVGN